MNRRFSTVAACALVVAGSVASGVEAAAIEGIQKYCTASWRQARIAQQDWNDCTQQVFLRLLDSMSRDGLIDAINENSSPERRELNRAIWATTKRWQRSRRDHVFTEAEVADSRTDDSTHREMRQLIDRADVLTSRQQEVLQLTLDGATVREIAAELQISASRVSDAKYKGIQRLRTLVAEHGVEAASSAA